MPLESAEYISELNPDWPLGTDPVNQGDDHDRVTKKALQQSFPNIDAACTPTPSEINSWEARIAALEGVEITQTDFTAQTEIDIIASIPGLYRVELYFDAFTTTDNSAGHGFRFKVADVAQNAGYQAASVRVADASQGSGENKTNQLPIFFSAAATDHRGFVRFDLLNGPGNVWTYQSNLARQGNPTVTLSGGIWNGGATPADGLQLRAVPNISGTFGGRYWTR